MKNRNLIYGLISGGIVSISMIFWLIFPGSPDMESLSSGWMMALGYLTMIVGFMTILIANRKTRHETEGRVTFWQLFRSGLIIGAIATVIYVAMWMVVYAEGSGKAMMDSYEKSQIEKIMQKDLTDDERDVQLKQTEDMMQSYRDNPLVRIGYTIFEIFPVALLMALISALFYRRKA